MKKLNTKALMPHFIAILIFLLISIIFCKPALDSNVTLKQSDVAGWQGMAHQSIEYEKQHGHYPLWIPQMFSGMPGYQVSMGGSVTPLNYLNLHQIFTLFLPKPISFFFLMCVSMYFLLMVLRVRPWVGILGAIAFAYSSYNPMAIAVGHETKIFTLAYIPAALASLILVFERKYFIGFTLTAIFSMLELAMNHQQINYYFFIIAFIMTISYIVKWLQEKSFTHAIKALSLVFIAAIIGIGVNIINLWVVSDYTNSSKRGGVLVIDDKKDNKVKNNKTEGLSKDYAFSWSYGKKETMSLMFPGIMGYGTHYSEKDGEQSLFPQLEDNSNVFKYLTDKLNLPEEQARQISMSLSQQIYWGDQPFTEGPVYMGAVICFLAIIGLFLLDKKHKWWIITAIIISIFLAWGKNFAAFNYFLFDHLPLYNKFRTPSMALTIAEVLIPVLATLSLNHIINHKDEKNTFQKLKIGGLATLGIFILAFGIYFTSDFSKENKERTKAFNNIIATSKDSSVLSKLQALNADEKMRPLADNSLYEEFISQSKGDIQIGKGIINALHNDRASFFLKDILFSLVYVVLILSLIFLYIKNKINTNILIAGSIIIATIDLISLDSKYLNDKNYDSKEKFESDEFPLTAADQKILQDRDPNYRVFDLSQRGDPFQSSKASYYHKSIGGYHPAKLGIYDDLITYQLSSNINQNVLNMLNTKYIIQPGQKGEAIAIQNPFALGNCWLVKATQWVDDAAEEMKALNNLNPKDTAVIDKRYKDKVSSFTVPDSSDYIRQLTFDNDYIKYESNTKSAQLAVFSEIYYKDWNAYIDGKKSDVIKANYVLRALMLPHGKHTIEFKMEPKSYFLGDKITLIFSWILFILIISAIYIEARKFFLEKKNTATAD